MGQYNHLEKVGSDFVRGIKSLDDPAFKGLYAPVFKAFYDESVFGSMAPYCLSKALQNRYV